MKAEPALLFAKQYMNIGRLIISFLLLHCILQQVTAEQGYGTTKQQTSNETGTGKNTKGNTPNLVITGKVLDGRTHLPLGNLWIVVKGTVFVSLTDSLGRFKFQLPDSLTAKDVFIAPAASTVKLLKSTYFNIPPIKVAIDDFPFKKNVVLYRFRDSIATSEIPFDSKLIQEFTEAAEFPGGRAALFSFLQKNIQYPQMERDNDIQGIVSVGFMVDENGEMKDIQAIKAISPGLAKEAMRVVKLMPRWRPAIYGNKPVRVYYILPVEFKIQG
jgi:TonB family protein